MKQSIEDLILENTKVSLADENIKVIFEGQIDFENLRARFDVLIKNDFTNPQDS